MSVLNFDDANRMVAEARRLMRRIDEAKLDDPVHQAKANAEKAALSRDLLRISHLLHMAANDIENTYWMAKGYRDPLEDE